MRGRVSVLCVFLAAMSARAALAEVETAPSTEGVLRFREDGTFTIVQFTDLHWGNGNEKDKQSLALMEAVLHEERPDLVVFTGDQIGGKKCLSAHKAIEWFTKPCVERALPWAAVFGNHDDECGVSREEQMDIMRSIPHCLAEPGPEDLPGVGHYVLPVHAGQGDKPAALLYCIDSLAYSEVEEIKGYDWIRPRQVQWYREKAAEYRALSSGEPLPALAFFHIPLPEYDIIWEKGDCIGQKHENVCCPKINSGLFAAMHEQGDVMGVFVGHDHVNDYIGELGGIRLAYGRGTGFDTYGRKDMPRGARVILLKEGKRDFKTWLRLEGGEKVEQDIGAP